MSQIAIGRGSPQRRVRHFAEVERHAM